MANERKMDCVLLGLLSHEALTGYEIKQRIDKGLSFFWGASFGSIYPTLADLVIRGFATKTAGAESKRETWVYTITEEGRSYLRNWLKKPVEKDELRYETLLKIFFGAETGPMENLAHIEAFRKKIETGLGLLRFAEENLRKVPDQERTHAYYLATVRMGILSYEAHLKWCEEAISLLGIKTDHSQKPEL